MSYLTFVKTMLVSAVQAAFDASYPVAQFAGVRASIEYPVDKQAYPGVWIDYEDTADLQVAGVSHVEDIDPSSGLRVGPFTRWRYTGSASFTVVALTSLERDRLYDELVNTIAFGRYDTLRGRFRAYIESNPFVVADINYDQIGSGGAAASPGTPWGTDEIVYERTFTLEMIGEFVPSQTTGALVLLSKVLVDPPVPSLPDGSPLIGSPTGPTAGDWH